MTDDAELGVDVDAVRQFWEERARRFVGQDSVNLSNLEEDPTMARQKHELERTLLVNYVAPEKQYRVLDLGAGHGAWAATLAPAVDFVDCVEYSAQMAANARIHFEAGQITNVAIHCMPAQDFVAEAMYDVVLISGLLIYLPDADVDVMLGHLRDGLKPGGRVVLRDGTAKDAPYTIRGRYSTELKSFYSAHYRTAEEYIGRFAAFGFTLVRHQDMFPAGSPFNKRKETILRIYEFRSGRE